MGEVIPYEVFRVWFAYATDFSTPPVGRERGQVRFVRSTLRAVPANRTCPRFEGRAPMVLSESRHLGGPPLPIVPLSSPVKGLQ